MNITIINHLEFIFLFIGFSLWLGAFILSFSRKGSSDNLVAREFRRVGIPLSMLILYELIAYYIMNQIDGPYPEWLNLFSLNLFLILFTLTSWRLLFLAAAMRSISISVRVQSRIKTVLIIAYILSSYFLQLTIKEILSPVIFLIFCSPLYAIGLVGSIILLLKKKVDTGEPRKVIFAAALLLILILLLEEFLFGFFEDISFRPQVYILFNLFFLFRWTTGTQMEKEQPFKGEVKNSLLSKYDISTREQEVLELLLAGESRLAIADKLFISENTVKTHISRIYKKMQVSNRAELFALFHLSERDVH